MNVGKTRSPEGDLASRALKENQRDVSLNKEIKEEKNNMKIEE